MRMYGYPIVLLSYAMYLLLIHLPNDEPQIFVEGEEQALVDAHLRGDIRKTKLTTFFDFCASDSNVSKDLYTDIVHEYSYTKNGWKQRQRKNAVVRRMQAIPPRYQEQFALRLLLLHGSGPEPFTDLKKYNGVTYAIFIKTARAMRLMQNDAVWKKNVNRGERQHESLRNAKFVRADIAVWKSRQRCCSLARVPRSVLRSQERDQ